MRQIIVSQSITVWLVTHTTTRGEVRLAMGRKYDHVKQFHLEQTH